jgi:hypothetical protein
LSQTCSGNIIPWLAKQHGVETHACSPNSRRASSYSKVFDVPTACLPALVHRTSAPGAPGARVSAVCAVSEELQIGSVGITMVERKPESVSFLAEFIALVRDAQR